MQIAGNTIKNLIVRLKSVTPANIVVVGDLSVEEYVSGAVTHSAPEVPVPVLVPEQVDWGLGGSANVAVNIAHVGVPVHLFGYYCAHDYAGAKLKALLTQSRVGIADLLAVVDQPTALKQHFVSKGYHLLRVDYQQPATSDIGLGKQLVQRATACIQSNTVLVLIDHDQGVLSTEVVAELLAHARAIGATVLVSAKTMHLHKYHGVNYLKLNRSYFEQLLAQITTSGHMSFAQQGRQLVEKLQLGGLVVTLGEQGVAFVSAQEHFLIPSNKRELYDLTGAGDTVVAFIACALAGGLSMHEALFLANHAASIAVSHHRSYAVGLDELLEGVGEPQSKVFHDWTMLKIELDWLRAEGKHIVVTTIVAHTLTAGHVQQLQYAKQAGHILVVGLHAPGALSRDMHVILAALRYVDFVVPLDQQTPQALIAYVQPDAVISHTAEQEAHV